MTPQPNIPCVHVDPVRGHIAVTDNHGRTAVLADTGLTLDVWTYQGVHLTPALAGQLGAALTAWAAQHGCEKPTPADPMQTDLLELIEAVEAA